MKYLITGGTGSLGRALTRKLKSIPGAEIIIYSRDEGKQALFFGQDSTIKTIIGDVRDFDRLNVTLRRLQPDYVIHAAALKRIDDIELQPEESIKTNIDGSENVAKASFLNNIIKCIFISTDKACQPVNVYGSSKFIAERVFTNYDFYSDFTLFASVRYGNVIASRGSFIPLWLQLLSEGKKIKVTSLEMTRFLFTLNDAVDAVLGALENCKGGEVFVPQIESYDMNTILSAVREIHGKAFDYDITGLRPGEKLHEDMLAKTELPYTYKVPNLKLLAVRPQYTKRAHSTLWQKYSGCEFNSSLHASNNTEKLIKLIKRGTLEAG